MNSLMNAPLSAFEQEVFETFAKFIRSKADDVARTLETHISVKKSYSCEPYLNQLFAMAFATHPFICVRESPYIDLPSTNDSVGQGKLDIMVIAPDKQHAAYMGFGEQWNQKPT